MATINRFTASFSRRRSSAPISLLLVMALYSLLSVQPSFAVMLGSTDDPTVNTTAPSGTLANSGWEHQGQWGGFLATPIAPQFFIAARHVGGQVGDVFTFQGLSYVTTAFFDDPRTDFRIWKVNGTFPTYAQLYTNIDEQDRDMIVFGRGTQRGAEVKSAVVSTNYVTSTVDVRTLGLTSKAAKKLFPDASFKGNNMTTVTAFLVTNTTLCGWQWGAYDGVTRWGKQKVYAAYDPFIVGAFGPSSDPNACTLSTGDSSGAVFLNDGTGWKLAGINYGVEGPFQTDLANPPFNAGLFDKSGLYSADTYWAPDGTVRPTFFYATRISTRLEWIRSVIGQQ